MTSEPAECSGSESGKVIKGVDVRIDDNALVRTIHIRALLLYH